MNLLKQFECFNIEEICRICLIKKNEMKILKDSGIENIISYIPIQMLEEEKLHFICIDCINKLQNWFEFYQQIICSFKIGHLVVQEIENKKQTEIISNSSTDIELPLLTSTTLANTNEENIFDNLTEFTCEINTTQKAQCAQDYECITLSKDPYKNNQLERLINTNSEISHKNYQCEKCGKEFKQVQTLKDHIKRHYNLRNFACSLCGKTFYKEFNVLEHMRIHTGERPFKCEFCVKTFTRALRLRNHIKKAHISDNRFSCKFCKKSFVDNYQLKIHMRTHTGEKPYLCSECEKAFALQGQLDSHIKYKHTKQKDFICNICARAFTAKHSLEAHIQVHSGIKQEPKHECSTCGKKCITTTQLKIHIKSQHTGERPFPCQICEKSFVTKSSLESHLRTHSGEKSYFCGECGKAFGTNSTLKIHRRIHTGERPFKCDHCSKTFTQASTLNTHMKIHKV